MRTLTLLVALLATACGGSSTPEPKTAASDTRSLYDRLGGTPAITAVVKRFVEVTGSDPRISMFFTNIDIPRIESMMVEHICEATGGPCTYSGKTMKESHTGMKVRKEHFDAFMDDLKKVLAEFKVPERETSEVIAFFLSLEADVVEPG